MRPSARLRSFDKGLNKVIIARDILVAPSQVLIREACVEEPSLEHNDVAKKMNENEEATGHESEEVESTATM